MENQSPDITKLDLDRLKWSTAYFTVSEFLSKFKLPQIAKVTAGFYGENDESTVSGDQVLCLHSVKSIESIRGRNSSGKAISVSLDCQKKVEVHPSNLKDVYENMEELCSAFPSYVRISQGYYDVSKDEEMLNVGDILHLKKIAKTKKGEKKLICINQNGQTLELPKDCVAGFRPMVDGKEYYLAEVVKKFPLPLHVRFVETYTIDQETRSKDEDLYQLQGTICLDRTSTETVITATAMQRNGQQKIVQFVSDIDINLLACEDAFRKSEDYANICHIFSQNTNTDTIGYIDMTQNLNKFSLNLARRFSSEKIKKRKTPPKPKSVEKPGLPARVGSSKTKSNRAKAFNPNPKPKVRPKSEIERVYAEPNEIYEEIGLFAEPTYTECRFLDSTYTELDPTNTPTNSHGRKAHNSLREKRSPPILPNRQLPNNAVAFPGMFNKIPPEVPPRTSDVSHNSLREKRSPPILPNRQLPNNAVALPGMSNKIPPEVPPRTSDLSARHGKKTTSTDCHSHKLTVTNSKPPLPTSLPGQSSSLPTPEPTREEKEEIYEAISKYPIDLSSLSVGDVSVLLNYLGMKTYVERFEAELIDGPLLASMDKESLESLNLIPFHVKKLMKFIGGWRPNSK